MPCIRSRIHASVGRPSVSLSIIAWTRCCKFAAVGPAGRRYQSIAARRTAARRANADSAMLSAYVERWMRRLVLLIIAVSMCIKNISQTAISECGVSKVSKRSIAVRDSPHRYGNSHAIWDHTVLPATRQRWHSRLYPSRKWYSIKRPRRDARLSWPSWLVTTRYGIPARRRSPIPVVTGPDVR